MFRYINSKRKVRVTKHILRKGLYSDQTLTGDRVNNKILNIDQVRIQALIKHILNKQKGGEIYVQKREVKRELYSQGGLYCFLEG